MWILGDYYSESRIFTWILNSPSTLDDINSHRYHFASNDVFFPLHIKALFWTYVTNDNILHGRHSLTLSRTETRQKFQVILSVTSLITKKKKVMVRQAAIPWHAPNSGKGNQNPTLDHKHAHTPAGQLRYHVLSRQPSRV